MENINIPNFIAIESDLLLDKNLSSTDKIAYAIICALSNNRDCACYATNKYICKLLHIKERQLRNCLNHLKQCNYVIITFIKNKRLIKPTINKFLENRKNANNQTQEFFEFFDYDWLNNDEI